MKKCLVISALFCGFFGFISGANAAKNCQLFSCGGSDSVNASANGYGSQCYYCNDSYAGDKQCGGGAVIGQVDPQGRITNLKQCIETWKDDYWKDFNPSVFCPNSDIQIGNPDATFPHSYKSYSLDNGNKTIGYISGDDTVLKAGNTACVYIKCNDGYMPNANKSECVADNRQSQCESSGGTWTGTACTCSSAKNLKLTADGKSCECINNNYEYDSGAKRCNKKQSVIDDEDRRRQQKQNQQRQLACQQSGGTWKNNKCECDAAKNLVSRNDVCQCPDDVNYKRVGDHCEITDAAALQRDCEETASRNSGAYWDATTKSCLCTNPQHVWLNKICQINPAIAACNQIYGAAWNNATKTCYCTDPDKEMNAAGTACIESSAAREKRESANSQLLLTQSRNRITETIKKINTQKSDFERTVWKTEDGKFNSTRLLSDSVAGVVLGTAGGLITSNVIKKNQVANGFDDIQCTVGGQVVAGWGDQFRVGIH